MDEATSDKENSSAGESKQSQQKTQGWIRIHLEEKIKPPPVDEPLGEKIPSPGRRIREEGKNDVE